MHQPRRHAVMTSCDDELCATLKSEVARIGRSSPPIVSVAGRQAILLSSSSLHTIRSKAFPVYAIIPLATLLHYIHTMDQDCSTTAELILDSLATLVECEARNYVKHDYCQQPAAAGALSESSDKRMVSSVAVNFAGKDTTTTPMKNSLSSTSLQDVQDIDRLQQSQEQATAPSEANSSFRFWRHQMIDWATVVVDSFGMDRELVAMSINLLDRYVAHELAKEHAAPITRDDFQLFSMTCLYLVIKLNEPYPRKLGVDSLVNMSRGFYSAEDVTLTELDILKALRWAVHPTTSASYVRLLLDVFPKDLQSNRMQNTAMTLTELAMTGGTMISCKESLVGLASVLYAARMDGVSEKHLQEFISRISSALSIDNAQDFEQLYRNLELAYGF